MAFKPMKKPSSSSSGTGKAKFKYRPRTSEEMNKRASQGGGSREGFARSDITVWTPADGENRIRILPPTWEDADHYGKDIYVHYSVGADNNAYVCRARAFSEPCPVCEARVELDHDGDDEGAKALLPRKRVAMFILNRADESKGPQLWFAPWTLERDIALVAMDDGGALALDDPESGYDITFSREKQGKDVPPKYVGVKAARRPSPVLDDPDKREELLEWLVENPLPECIVYHDYDVIARAFGGGESSRQQHAEQKGKPSPASTRGKPAPTKPAAKKKEEPPEEEEEASEEGEAEVPTWEDLEAMDADGLAEFVNEAGLEGEDVEFEDEDQMRSWIAEQLGVEKPAPKKLKPGLKPKLSAKVSPKKPEPEEEPEADEEESAPPPKKKGAAATKGEEAAPPSWKTKLKTLAKK